MTTLDKLETPLVKFTAQDRCDRCGAQAMAEARHEDMPQPLLFCGHHRNKHFEALLASGWSVRDDYEAWEKIASGDLTTADSD